MHTPRPFADYLYFNDEAHRRSRDFALTSQEVLTGVITGRAAGSGLKSFARYYGWPGAVYVPVLGAVGEQLPRCPVQRHQPPEVRVFRALTIALAQELGPLVNR